MSWKILEKKLQNLDYTDFQIAVYKETYKIPRGKTRSYADIARVIGRPGASRAVGSALAKNPFAPKIPCHRVIHSDGTITGFSGSMDPHSEWNKKKRALLRSEGAL